MQNVLPSHHPVPGRPSGVGHRFLGQSRKGTLTIISIVNLIGLLAVAWPAVAHPEAQLLANHVGLAGIDCATRLLPREIAPNHFVLDQTTSCAPIVRRVVTASETMLEDQSIEGEAAVVLQAPTADQLPSWSPSRDRLSNRQYARSLRELGRGVRHTSR